MLWLVVEQHLVLEVLPVLRCHELVFREVSRLVGAQVQLLLALRREKAMRLKILEFLPVEAQRLLLWLVQGSLVS